MVRMNMPKEDLYQKIDEDDEMTDQEKRETYFAEIENEEAEEIWRDE